MGRGDGGIRVVLNWAVRRRVRRDWVVRGREEGGSEGMVEE